MYLSELKIQGFKSFASPVRVDLDKGITCVVGPNGCGKSNLVEAIRWVLGEQSTKSLRGSKMQEVIFQGSKQRAPLAFCQVSLKFTECEDRLGTEREEVEITRKMSLDGEGEYLLNRQKCRLKDIQELFMDTGMGKASYSFIMQGKIDTVLAANSQQRRGIFEEAAGITHYKYQRHIASNKLRLVDENLKRVTDIMEELGKQLGSLQRQARRALRYRELKSRQRHLKRARGALAYRRCSQALEKLKTSQLAKQADLNTVENELEKAHAHLQGFNEQKQAFRTTIAEGQKTLFKHQEKANQATWRLDSFARGQKDFQARFHSFQAQVEQLKKSLEGLKVDSTASTDEELPAAASLREAQQAFEKESRLATQFSDKLEKLASARADSEEALLKAENDLARRRQGHASLQIAQSRHVAERDTRSTHLATLKEKHELLEKELAQATAVATTLKSSLSEAEKAEKAAEALHETAEKQAEKRTEELKKAEKFLADCQARLRALADVTQKLEGFSQGAKALLTSSEPLKKPLVLSELLQLKPQFAKALDALLGVADTALYCESWELCLNLLRLLDSRQLGGAALCFPTFDVPVPSKLPNVPAGWYVVSEVVSTQEPSLNPALTSLFRACYFAESLDKIIEARQQHPHFDFQAVATFDGVVVERSGLVFDRRAGGQGGQLARRARLAALKEQIVEGQASCKVAKKRLLEAEEDYQESVARQGALARETATGAAMWRSSTQELAALKQSFEQSCGEMSEYQAALKNLETLGRSAEKNLRESQVDLEAKEEILASSQEKFQAAREAFGALERARSAHGEAQVRARLKLAEKQQVFSEQEAGRQQSGEARRVNLARLREAEQAALESEASLLKLRGQIDSAKLEKAGSLALRREKEGDLEGLEKAEVMLGKHLEKAEKALEKLRHRGDQAKQDLHVLDLKQAKLEAEVDFIQRGVEQDDSTRLDRVDYREELCLAEAIGREKFSLKTLLEEGVGKSFQAALRPRISEDDKALMALEQFSEASVDGQLEQLKQQLSGLGSVNLVAVEQYGDLKGRHQHLKTQSEDLWAAKESLLKAIEDIDLVSERKFKEAFEQIRANFREIFIDLFGGGKADVVLEKSEGNLEAGIEIMARPPGTRLKNLSLLSGGQRAMTVLALLFAIYRLKSSPFVVLDELDAPLDDGNIGRFIDLVRKFTRHTQFIIVTHNKRTVSAARRVYGATMQERGVTDLVSLSYEEPEGERLAKLSRAF